MQYQHRQIGTAILLIMGTLIFFIIYVATNKNDDVIWPLILTLAIVSFLFHSLNIKVDSESVAWSFGPGFWKKSVAIDSINTVSLIKTKWYYGLGIRLIPTGWLYAVSGTTAVELELENGIKVSLGTNDPDDLIKAIQSQLTIRSN